jgi:acyl transferase domain-containing protein/acyl carrier protein
VVERDDRRIALVGIGCRLPGGGGDPTAARALFTRGHDVVGTVPAGRFTLPATTPGGRPVPTAGAFLDGVDRFDAALFGLSAREAAATDPQQRLLLQCAWAALEDAGVRPDRLDGSATGTWLALGTVDWAQRTWWRGQGLDAGATTGALDAVAAGRVAYTFGLRGPALVLHAACAGTHAALHAAARALRAGEVELALAGGAQLQLAPEPTVAFAELGALSPTGRCRTFDAAADGYVRGEGVGVFALMRLVDAVDRGLRVHAVLEGSAMGHDGRTNGLTAPSARAQAEVLRDALDDARHQPGDVGFVEAHGTGTPLGDPVEIEALAAVYGRAADRPLHVSSGKTVVGHLEAAAGVAGVLRAIGALAGHELPPHLHLRALNPRLPLAGTRLLVGRDGGWDGLAAGVSGFGLSGTNVHLVFSRPPAEPRPLRWPVLVALSAPDPATLAAKVEQVRADPERWAVGAATARAAHRHRAARVLGDPTAARAPWPTQLAGRAPGVAWVVPDRAEPAAARWAERYPAVRKALREAELAARTRAADDPAVAAFAWGWAQLALLRAAGVEPDAVVAGPRQGLLAAAALGERTLSSAATAVARGEQAPCARALPNLSDAAAQGLTLAVGRREAAGVEVLPLDGVPETALTTFGALFVRGVDVEPRVVVDGDRDEVPVHPFRAERHWWPAEHQPVVVDFALRERPLPEGTVAALRADAAAWGAAACRRWSGAVGPLAVVDPACPDDLAARALAALPAGVDEVRVDAAGRATTEVLAPGPQPMPAGALDRRPVLVVGGTGHVGRAVVAALAGNGVRHFVVWSRTPPAAPWPAGVTVEHVAVDLAGPLPSVGDVQGAVHAAADPDPARTVAALDAALPGRWLVVVGSVAARWGSPGLEGYAAGHRAAEEVVRRRVAAGHAGAVVLAGPVAGGGRVGDESRAAFARAGVGAVPADRVAAVVAAVAGASATVGVGDFDWRRLVPLAERHGPRGLFDDVRPPVTAAEAGGEGLLERVLALAGELLGTPPDPDRGFFAAGFDSVLAVTFAQRLSAALGRPLPDTVVFDHATPRGLAAALGASAAPPPITPPSPTADPVAIVGLALRVPGADSPDALWALLASDRDPLGPVPADRWDAAAWPAAPAVGGFVDAASFDAARFGLGPAEAAATDPQQRLFLTVGAEALERAGLDPRGLAGQRVAVFAGVGRAEYRDRLRDDDVYAGVGAEQSFVAGRLAHWLGTRGEALSVDTACSSSLVAVHLACRALRSGDAALALAGGVQVLASPESGAQLTRLGALSPTGRCRPFDALADGYVRSEGCVVFVLQRLADARAAGRRVLAVLEGSAVGHDGRSAGLGVPSGAAQEDVVRRALADAGRAPDDVDGVSVHGTGTPLGDPIEVGALAGVFAGRTRPLWLSATKSRLGHLEAAAGAVALAAVVLSLQRGAVFPNAALTARNPRLPAGPWALPDALLPWPPTGRRRAGVSAFGLSGTGAHVLVAEAEPGGPEPAITLRPPGPRAWVPPPDAPLPCLRVAWGPAAAGHAPAEVALRPVSAVDDVLALARALPPGTVVLRAEGVFGGVDPAQAALGGAFTALAAERPDRDLRLFDGVPDDGLDAALRTGAARVWWRDGAPHTPALRPAEPGPALVVRGTWLVSGGDGAVGRAAVAWLRARGAGVEVLSRSRGADVSDAAQVAAAAARVRARGEVLGGALHAAGVAGGALAHAETAAGVAAVWAAKVDGARHLSEVVGDAPFVAIGSAAAWFGLPGQAAYAAANAGVEAVVRGRRARGWPGVVLAPGPLLGGLADAVDWTDRGVVRADPARAVAVLGALPGDAVVMPIVLTEARAASPPAPGEVLPRIQAVAREVLGREVDADAAFVEAGVDSLAAVELSRRLSRAFGVPLPAALVYEHPTPRAVAQRLAGSPAPARAPRPPRPAVDDDGSVAIIGMAVRFPGAPDADALWALLAAGRVAIGPVPPDRWDADALFTAFPGAPGRAYVREGGFLDDVDAFEPEAFGISPREAASLDPQQRLLLEVTREALEDAGHAGPGLAGSRTAVYVGVTDRGWLDTRREPGGPLYPDAWAGTGNEAAFAAGRVAHAFDLRGEALALNTACSSSLVALDHAVRALRDRRAELALAGAVSLMFRPDDTAYLCALGALSPTHRCHAFDARADGYVRAEGCGVFVLARLADARARGDRVLAVVRGTAVGHDGGVGGLTAPNGAAQQDVLRAALADADLAPGDVGWLEAHGTGTRLGDPVELAAASAVYGEGRAAPLLVTAVKANVGHAELASGAASLAAVLLAARHGALWGHPDLGEPNPELPREGVELVRAARPLPPGLRHAAISAFGLSGTNAHVVLELPAPNSAAEEEQGVVGGVPLLASAPTETAARALARALAAADPAPADVCATLARRAHHRVRLAVVAADRAEARALAEAPLTVVAGPPTVAFLASGQGSQVAGMGLALDAFPAHREALDACAAVLDPLLGRPLRALLADPAAVDRTEFTQPLLFATSWATAALLRRCGVEPAVVAGHSLGELVAAALAGVWSLDDALRLAAERGRLMAERALPGAMAAVALPADVVAPLLAPGAELAAINAPDEVVVAGPADAVEATLAALPPGSRATRLPVSRPFHTACVDPMLAPFEAAVAAVPARRPDRPLVSLATAREESDALTTAAFWRDHVRRPVRCADAARVLATRATVFVDLGPTPVLSTLVRRNGVAGTFVATGRRDLPPARAFASALAELWLAGAPVDASALAPRGRQVALPPTPFARRPVSLPRVDAVAPASLREVRWDVVAADGPLPARVRVRGDTDGSVARALSAAGVAVADDAPVTIDLRRGLGALRSLTDVAGERWVVAIHPLDPERWALRAAARCARLERPATRVDVVHAADADALVRALRADRDEVDADGPTTPRLAPLPPAPPPQVRGRWLVTGGTGAVGSALAGWLAARGASGLLLAARRPPEDTVRAALAALPCPVDFVQVDVSDEDAVRALLAAHAVDGVVHAAGVTRPQPLEALDDDTVAATLAAKVGGARALDRWLPPEAPLVLVGSVAAVWGSRGLTAYAAANGALVDVVVTRRARGGRALCVQFGPWAGGGMVDPAGAAELARAGLLAMDPRAALHGLQAVWDGPAVAPVVARADWPRLASALGVGGAQGLFAADAPAEVPVAPRVGEGLQERLLRHARAVLALPMLAPDRPLADVGLDSLLATELKQRLLQDGVDVPLARLLAGPSVAALGAGLAPPAPAPAAAEDEPPVVWWTHAAAVVVGMALAAAAWAVWSAW